MREMGFREFHLTSDLTRRKDLTPGAKLIYSALCWYWDRYDRVFPKVKTLAIDAGVSERSARRHLAELIDLCMIELDEAPGTTHTYRPYGRA